MVRSQWLGQGVPLSEVTARLAARWGLPDQRVRLLPMSDTPVETHVVVDEGDGTGPQAVHFQEWWVRMRAAVPAQRFVAVGMDRATPAPGVLDAIREADVVLLPPSNPVVSIGIILGVPGVRDALRGSRAPVVGVSPLIGGAPGARARRRLPVAPSGSTRPRAAVAGLYADFLDGWLVDDADKELADAPGRLRVVARPLWMHDVPSTADIAGAAVDLALQPARRRRMTPPAAEAPTPVTLTPLLGMPEVHPGDDLAEVVVRALATNGIQLADGDVLVVSSKVASKALGLTAPAQDRSAAVLCQSRRVVAERDTPLGVTRVVEAVAGPVMAAAGVDASNTGAADVVLLLPRGPRRGGPHAARADRAAAARGALSASSSATRRAGPGGSGRPTSRSARPACTWSTTCAAASDGDGRELSVTERCVGDEIAAAADLVKGKAAGVPVAHVRGLAAGGPTRRGHPRRTDPRAHRPHRLVRLGPGRGRPGRAGRRGRHRAGTRGRHPLGPAGAGGHEGRARPARRPAGGRGGDRLDRAGGRRAAG